jgi:preprotein translocase subunit YajC
MLYALLILADNAKEGEGQAPFILSFLPIILIFVLFYFLLILPAQRRERRQREAIMGALKKNDKVLTTAGIIGVVANIKDEEVTLRLEEGKMRVLRSAITKIFGPEEPAKDQKQEVGKSS